MITKEKVLDRAGRIIHGAWLFVNPIAHIAEVKRDTIVHLDRVERDLSAHLDQVERGVVSRLAEHEALPEDQAHSI